MTEAPPAKEYSEFQDRYEGESDRAVAILATTYLEKFLRDYLSSRLVQHKRVERMFQGYAPFSTFSALIDASYAVGLLPLHIAEDLHFIRKIRNKFAHSHEDLNFDSQNIQDLLQNISYSRGMPRTDGTRGAKPKSGRALFLTTVFWCVFHMDANQLRVRPIEPSKHVWKEVANGDA